MLHEILLRAYFSHSVKYWYEICEVSVPIFHVLRGLDTDSSHCEIKYTVQQCTLCSDL